MPLRYILLAYPLTEILAAFLLAYWIGWGWTLLILLAGIPIGIIIMRVAGIAAFASLREAARGGRLPDGAPGSHGLTFLAGLLIVIPGLCTNVAGLLVLTPPIRESLRRRLARKITIPGGFPIFFAESGANSSDGPNYAQGDVIPGEVIHSENEQTGPATKADPAGKIGPI